MAILTLVFGRDVLGMHEIDTEKVVVGRADDSDVTIDNLAVSRHHAIIEKVDGGYSITDLDSNNGTFVNGRRINTPSALSFGDEIGIGKHILVFDSHSKKIRPARPHSAGEARPEMDAGGRGTMFVEPAQMEKIQEKVVASRKAHLETLGSSNGLIVLEKNDVTFGKDPNSDIVVNGFFTARRHAMLSRIENGFQITNFAILSPARVNGIVIDATLLCDKDEIKVGKKTFIFRSGR
jgi:pSer/pThr/pTyr-binding forkhead associated (FHA) protein